MADYRIISGDSHVVEPPDLWETRIEPRFRDQAPRLVREEGSDWWYCEGIRLPAVIFGTQYGQRFEDQAKMNNYDVFENVLPGSYIPEEQIKDMDADGIYANVLYPSTGLLLYSIKDSELLSAIFRAYNDWMADFSNAFPKRLNGIGMLNIDDVEVGIKEMERCANIGLVGAMIPVYLGWGVSYEAPEYEALWAAAQDIDMPLSLHLSTDRKAMGDPLTATRAAFQTNRDFWVRESLADMVLGGVFEKFPKLRVGAIEQGLSWVPHFLERVDYDYTQRSINPAWHRYKEDMLPSDYFHRNVFISFQEDAVGIRLRDIIGVDNMQWGSDYPHPEGTFPRTREILEEILADCTEEEKAKIIGENAASMYHID